MRKGLRFAAIALVLLLGAACGAQPMFDGVDLDVLANGPGHWPGTPMPGDVGNVVVAGHRVTHTHPFLDIDQLNPGDQVIFTTSAGRFVYAVTQTFIVTPDAT